MITINTILNTCKEFQNHQISFIIIGGTAEVLYGIKGISFDIDILLKPNSENLEKLQYFLNLNKEYNQQIDPNRIIRLKTDSIDVDIHFKVDELCLKEAFDKLRIIYIEEAPIPIIDKPLLLKYKSALKNRLNGKRNKQSANFH